MSIHLGGRGPGHIARVQQSLLSLWRQGAFSIPGITAATAGDNVTNYYTTPSSGVLVNQLYNNTGPLAALQAFATSGLIPITAAMRASGLSISCDPAKQNWVFNAARINFYNAATPSSGALVSSVTSGVTLSGDIRTVTCTAGAIPGGATHFGTNLKWAQGYPSLVYSSSNVIPSGEDTLLAAALMVNVGTTPACLTAYGAAGTSDEVSTAPLLSAGQFIYAKNGYKSLTRKPFVTGSHMVQRFQIAPGSHDYNPNYDMLSAVSVTDTTPAPSTPGAFSANFSVTGTNATTFAVQSDCTPAYKINGLFLGGGHGVLGTRVTAAAHGKTNVDRGSIWSKGGTNYILAHVYSTGLLDMVPVPTGGETDWSISSTVATTGTFAHVSGATNTGDITATACAQVQIYPNNQVIEQKTVLQGLPEITANGAYNGSLAVNTFRYKINNPLAVLNYIVANVGSSGDFNFNDPAISAQVYVNLVYADDAWSTSVLHEVAALQGHTCNYSFPTQFQAINARASASETLWFIVPGTVSCAAGVAHDLGTPLDFSSWQNISSNALEYYQDSTTAQAAGWWSDNVQRAPLVEAYGVKDSGGTFIRKFVMARSRVMGATAASPFPSQVVHLLSAFNKAYGVTRYNETVTAGDVRTVIAGYGWMDPAFDTSADINFAFPLGGGSYEFNWWSSDDLTDYAIPLRDDLSGKSVQIICQSANCTISTASGISISKTGAGGFTALLS